MLATDSTTSRPLDPVVREEVRNVRVGRKPPGKTGEGKVVSGWTGREWSKDLL